MRDWRHVSDVGDTVTSSIQSPEVANEIETAIRSKLLAVAAPKAKESDDEAEPQLDL